MPTTRSLAHAACVAALLCQMAPGMAHASTPGQPDARIARGEEVLKSLNRGGTQPVFEAMRQEFPFLADATAAYALGDVWGRTVLDARTRQLAAMAAFAALGLRPFFKVHAGYAIDAGVPVEELKEIVYLVTVPAGFARAIDASQALHELLQERGLTVGPSPARTP